MGSPHSLNASTTSTTIHLQWTAPFDPDSVIKSFAIVYQLISTSFSSITTPRPKVIITGINDTSHTIESLLVSSTYKISVMAVYEEGNGPKSEELYVTTKESGNFNLKL